MTEEQLIKNKIRQMETALRNLRQRIPLLGKRTREMQKNLNAELWNGQKISITNPQDNQFIGYDETTGLWVNKHARPATGFIDPGSVNVAYDSATRKVTVTGDIRAAYNGIEITGLTTNDTTWTSDAHTDSAGGYFLYYDGSSFVWTTAPWPFTAVMIAFVYYQTSDKFALREAHGLTPWEEHQANHYNRGTWRKSGGVLGGYVLSSTTAADRRPTITACEIWDEDNPCTNPALSTNSYTQFYLSSTDTTNFNTAQTDIVPLSGNNPYYNQLSGGTWGQTLMPANSLATVWIYAVPVSTDSGSQAYRFVFIQPQWITQATGSGSPQLATAQEIEEARSLADIDLGDLEGLLPEGVAIARVTIQYTSSNWTIENVLSITGTRENQTTQPAPSVNLALSELIDVNITSITDGDILTWDNTNSEWINEAVPTKTLVIARRATAQTFNNNTVTTIIWTTEDTDTLGEYDNTTGIFSPASDKTIRVAAHIMFASASAGSLFRMGFRNNSGTFILIDDDSGNAQNQTFTLVSTFEVVSSATYNITMQQITGGNITSFADARFNRLTIEEI